MEFFWAEFLLWPVRRTNRDHVNLHSFLFQGLNLAQDIRVMDRWKLTDQIS